MIASLLTQRNHLTDQYEFLILTMYVDAIHRGDLHIAMRVLLSYEDLVLRNDKKVLQPLLQSLVDSPFQMDNKLAMIKLFIPKIQFQHVDLLVANL